MSREEKIAVLQHLTIGSRVAEDEVEQLASYFVETDQWRKVVAGEVDVVFGPKGGGKSAIYSSLLNRSDEMFDRGILFVSGEVPRGAPAFRDLVEDPPTTEPEFVGLWKVYMLSLLAGVFEEYAIDNEASRRLTATLREAGLYASGARTLSSIVRAALDYVRSVLRPESIEGGVDLDPATGLPRGIRGKITLREPAAAAKSNGAISVDDLLAEANTALTEADITVWILLDRLDVAFSDTPTLEANALRALFKVYLDTVPLDRLNIKIFLRSDIWRAITESGFREASHLTRTLELEWKPASLLNLLVRRLLQNADLVNYYDVDPEDIVQDVTKQREFFDRVVPEQVDLGRNPKTFEWMLGRVRDGTGRVAPRELIHLATVTRDVQIAMLERGEEEPPETILFSRQAFRDALPEVSKVRVEQTLFAEYAELKPRLIALEGQKTSHNPDSLATIWGLSAEDASKIANDLVDIGFFERRGSRTEPDYWVPFLYRPALKLVQGPAEGDADSEIDAGDGDTDDL